MKKNLAFRSKDVLASRFAEAKRDVFELFGPVVLLTVIASLAFFAVSIYYPQFGLVRVGVRRSVLGALETILLATLLIGASALFGEPNSKNKKKQGE